MKLLYSEFTILTLGIDSTDGFPATFQRQSLLAMQVSTLLEAWLLLLMNISRERRVVRDRYPTVIGRVFYAYPRSHYRNVTA